MAPPAAKLSGCDMDNSRNLILAIALSLGFLLVYQYFIIEPAAKEARERSARERAAAPVATAMEGVSPAAASAAALADESTNLATAARIAIRSQALSGSISLYGARFDDLTLERYDTTLRTEDNPNPPPVTLLKSGTEKGGYHAVFGWLGGVDEPRRDLPGPRTLWQADPQAVLTPTSPVRLSYMSADGLQFTRLISMDEDYLFTVTDLVENRSAGAVSLSPYGRVRRIGIPEDLSNFMILHEGLIGVLGKPDSAETLGLLQRKYKKLEKEGNMLRRSKGGWLGITDKYWLAAIIPNQAAMMEGSFNVAREGTAPRFDTLARQDAIVIGAGQSVENTMQFFAGAKRSSLISQYETEQGIPKLDLAIDWGNFWFLTKPMFAVLSFFQGLLGNFGFAILALTVVVKILFFPLANASYKSMAKMKEVNPKIQELRKRFAADPQRLQKEQMALFQREGVNPLAGCMPILLQMPVFYALYKTLFVTLEMRHAPFIGYIRDLSAPDPTSIWNLFGLLPWNPAAASTWMSDSVPFIGPIIGSILVIGFLPVLMGVSMAAMQTLNPPPPDKMQARIFAAMPVVLTVIMAPFAAGLVLYWTWNNILSFLQQYLIVRRMGQETPIGSWMARRWGILTGKIRPVAPANDRGNFLDQLLPKKTKALSPPATPENMPSTAADHPSGKGETTDQPKA
jgi:YidC/Oxa1 family membrane protein insertase